MKTSLLLTPCVLAAGLFLSSCADVEYDDDDRRSYRSTESVDFYYTSGRPYSRSYGALVQRDGRYYYSRGGRYVIYDRPTTVYRSGPRVVERDVVVRSRYEDDRPRVIQGDPHYDDATDSRLSNDGVRRTRVYRADDDRRGVGTRVRVYER